MIESIFLSNLWLLKSSLILAGVIALQFLLKKRISASFRHLMWTLGFMGMLLAPLVDNLSARLQTEIEIPVTISKPYTPDINLLEAEDNLNIAQNLEIYTTDNQKDTASKGINWIFWLKTIWGTGVSIFLLLLLIEKYFLFLLYQKSQTADTVLLNTLKSLNENHLPNQSIQAVLSNHIEIPFTAGWRKPVIFLHQNFESLPESQQRLILLHEIAHIRRKDALSNLITQLTCAIFWFNPLIWLTAHWSKIDMEKACDDWVIQVSDQKYDYASMMLDIIEKTQSRLSFMHKRLAFANKNELKMRMLAILDEKVNRSTLSLYAQIACLIIAVAMIIPFASVKVLDATQEGISNINLSYYLKQLKEGNDDERKYAAWALGSSENKRSTDALIKELDHKNPEVRAMVLWALGELKVKCSLKPMVYCTKDKTPFVREMAVKSIGELEDPSAIKYLKKLLNDPAPGVKTASIWALGEINTPKSLKLVINSLKKPCVNIKITAAKTLGEKRYKKAVPYLANLLKHKDQDVRLSAIIALDKIHHKKTIPFLTNSLQDQSASVRTQAVHALGNLKNKKAVKSLIPLLQDPSVQVREMTVWALDELEL